MGEGIGTVAEVEEQDPVYGDDQDGGEGIRRVAGTVEEVPPIARQLNAEWGYDPLTSDGMVVAFKEEMRPKPWWKRMWGVR